jgi:hypothetical protein
MPIPIRFSKGNTPEERLNSIETTLRHFSRRLVKVAETIVPPVPIFARENLLEIGGILFKGLIPYRGHLGIAAIHIGKFLQRPVMATFKIHDSKGGSAITINCDRRFNSRDLNHPFIEPVILEVIIEPYDAVEEILVAVLTHPELSVTNREQHILDAVLKSYELAEDLEDERDENLQSDA